MKKNRKAEINRIEKRTIEALAIAPFIKAISQILGKSKTLSILK